MGFFSFYYAKNVNIYPFFVFEKSVMSLKKGYHIS